MRTTRVVLSLLSLLSVAGLFVGNVEAGLVFIGGRVVGIDDVVVTPLGIVDVVFDYGTLSEVNGNIGTIFQPQAQLPYPEAIGIDLANTIATALNNANISGTNPLQSFFESVVSNTVTIPVTPSGSNPNSRVVSFSGSSWSQSGQSYSAEVPQLLAFYVFPNTFDFTSSPIPEPTSLATVLGAGLLGLVFARRRKISSR
ncbi:MAG: hypothetical protein KatS3mg109_2102 [Pirellulaceae bacterium]|nr:MAG: hypothetical protein KatS3mg109_2102 [Pirellulaceae bacterium]